ncbi:MAG: hypothetical protein GWN07_21515, partial [Actinobacteria bacterium]|nr:hypothetical protein [Actinomycetota bacterium]NIS33047.1 hypothetical protein [Actinomycetota bacterium]NIU67976.1 hypothetical protein [Actinomycetota bacterium]NIV86783.1 hypothetical protein [Actinomycetota bacterium]NIW29769.1 hypothetical protein [Actinomycetota bacterium]
KISPLLERSGVSEERVFERLRERYAGDADAGSDGVEDRLRAARHGFQTVVELDPADLPTDGEDETGSLPERPP